MFIFTDCFEISCIGRVLFFVGSRLKNEENMHVSLCFSSMIIFTDGFWNSVYWQGTVSSRLTLKERGIHTRFPVLILGVYFHWLLLKLGILFLKLGVLLVLSSRLKNEENMLVTLCFLSMIFFSDGFWNSVYWYGTVSSRLTLNERGIHTLFPVFILGV